VQTWRQDELAVFYLSLGYSRSVRSRFCKRSLGFWKAIQLYRKVQRNHATRSLRSLIESERQVVLIKGLRSDLRLSLLEDNMASYQQKRYHCILFLVRSISTYILQWDLFTSTRVNSSVSRHLNFSRSWSVSIPAMNVSIPCYRCWWVCQWQRRVWPHVHQLCGLLPVQLSWWVHLGSWWKEL